MSEYPSFQTYNTLMLQLMEALIGKVTPNLRRVVLAFEAEMWHLEFSLSVDSEDEREEISEIVASFEALQQVSLPISIDVIVSSEVLTWPDDGRRVVYWRRE